VYLRTAPTSRTGQAIWSTEAWYTMNAKPTVDVPARRYAAQPIR
ncbi:MAG: hypothetical protein RL354_1631, partial [Planctomycetota bacterium]